MTQKRVVVKRHYPVRTKKIKFIQIGYLLSVRHLGQATALEVSRHRECCKATAHMNLAKLVALGMLDTTCGERNARVYTLTEEGQITAAAALRGGDAQ